MKTEIKPVFETEADLYRSILSEIVPSRRDVLPVELFSFYNTTGEVVIDGQKVFRFSLNKESRNWTAKFFKPYIEHNPEFKGTNPHSAVTANLQTLRRKEEEAVRFLNETIETYPHLPLAVSFSGGKDSLVALALTKIVQTRFDAIFLNTTVEFEETVSFVHETAQLWGVNLIETVPSHGFFELCGELGPPSTRMKWCCKTQKFSPQNQLINTVYPDGLLVVNGIRKAESNIRSKFDKVQRNKMIPKQVLAFPILDWSSLDVWLYLAWKRIPHNKMYDYGFSRIGCWACPEKSLRDLKLIEIYRPDLSERLKQMLRQYALYSCIDKPEDWIKSGNWRSRKTKWSKTTICKSSRLCSIDLETVYSFEEGPHLARVYEFMSVFGRPIKKGVITKICSPRIEITLMSNKMRVKLIDSSILTIFEKQLSRALNCVGCGACVGSCDNDALKIESGELKVGEQCTGCLHCITSNGIRMSCVSVNYKPEILVVA